jgi:hypothetical protein
MRFLAIHAIGEDEPDPHRSSPKTIGSLSVEITMLYLLGQGIAVVAT